jgi:hypothetical protein
VGFAGPSFTRGTRGNLATRDVRHEDAVEGKTKLLGLLAGISIYASAVQPAAAILITASGSGSDGPLAASADFTFNSGVLTVTISNLLSAATIRSVGQTVSDLSFTLSNPPGTLGTTSAAGQLANIGSGGSVTNVAETPTRWLGAGGQGDFSISGNTITLEAIGGGQPDQLILPSGSSFPNANASITGGQFSPFVVGCQSDQHTGSSRRGLCVEPCHARQLLSGKLKQQENS